MEKSKDRVYTPYIVRQKQTPSCTAPASDPQLPPPRALLFWIRREVWMQLHRLGGRSCFAISGGSAQGSQQKEGATVPPRSPSPGHRVLHLPQGSIPRRPPARYTNPELPPVHALYFRQQRRALKGTQN